jgi:two-component system response regulator NreC
MKNRQNKSTTKPIRILLVDDHVVVRSGLRMLLEARPGFHIIGEAETGLEALEMVNSLRPDVVLMDIQMPDMNGIEATRQLKKTNTKSAILALTMYEDDQYFFEMLHAGAACYILKRAAPDELVNAIHTVANGDIYLYPSLATRLVQDYLRRADVGDQPLIQDHLTPRELEILTLIAEGYTNAEIGQELVISPKTVDTHRENIMRKLNLRSRVDLVKYALKMGIIDLEDS